MTPSELIRDLPTGPGDPRENRLFARLLLRYLADHVDYATLNSGQRLRDALDFRTWLEELFSAGSAPPANTAGSPLRSTGRARDYSCPECGHEHEGQRECKKYLGEGRFCPCEVKVTA